MLSTVKEDESGLPFPSFINRPPLTRAFFVSVNYTIGSETKVTSGEIYNILETKFAANSPAAEWYKVILVSDCTMTFRKVFDETLYVYVDKNSLRTLRVLNSELKELGADVFVPKPPTFKKLPPRRKTRQDD